MPMKNEKFHIVPFGKGFRVMSDNGTFFSQKPLTKTMALRQQRALYAKARKGEIYTGGSFTMMRHGGQSHLILKGEGFIGDFFGKVKQGINKTVNTVRNVGQTVVNRIGAVSKGIRNDYPPRAREMLATYGNGVVKSLLIRREPIQSFINVALNFITQGKWGQAKKELNYDKLYHLSLVATLALPDGSEKTLVVEKNEVININDNYSFNTKMAYITVPVLAPLSFGQMMENAKNAGGANYFKYDAFTNNCQMFINLILDANGLNSPEVRDFVLQPVDALLKKLPSYTSPFANTLTNIAGLANVAMYGEGEDVIEMKPKDFFAEHKKLVALLDGISSKLDKARVGDKALAQMLETISNQLRDEAKEQSAEANTWRRKLEGKREIIKGGVRLRGHFVEGAGQSEYSKRHIQKLKEFAQLPEEEQKRISAEAEERRKTLVNPMVERNQRVAEYNAEMRRRANSPFAPIVDGLTKVADFAVEKVADKIGVPKVVSEAYKAFAPPGSKFHGGAHSKFQTQIAQYGLTPKQYLAKARRVATKKGYVGKNVEFSNDGLHKLMITTDDGRKVKFGRVGYKDHLIYTLTKDKDADKEREKYLARATKIKGDWKDDKFSPNSLAINILW